MVVRATWIEGLEKLAPKKRKQRVPQVVIAAVCFVVAGLGIDGSVRESFASTFHPVRPAPVEVAPPEAPPAQAPAPAPQKVAAAPTPAAPATGVTPTPAPPPSAAAKRSHGHVKSGHRTTKKKH